MMRDKSIANSADATTPLVSVVIPMHNSSDCIVEAVQSLLAQTYPNIEVICVDDASEDDTVSLVEGLIAMDAQTHDPSRIKLIRNKRNMGPGASRNVGIKAATGQYLYCLDSDDFVDPTLIQKVVDRFEQTDAEMLVIPHMEYDEQTERSHVADWSADASAFLGEVSSWRDNPDYVFHAIQNFPWNKVLRMDYLRDNDILFQEDIWLTEDLMYAAKAIVNADKIAFVDEPLVYHRVGTGMNVMSAKDKHPVDFLKAFLTLKKYLQNSGIYDDLRIGFSNWAALACVDNLFTLKTYKGYNTAFKALAGHGMRDLGLYDLPLDQYFDEGCKAVVSSLRERRPSDAAEYAHLNFVVHRDLAGNLQGRIAELEGQLRDLEAKAVPSGDGSSDGSSDAAHDADRQDHGVTAEDHVATTEEQGVDAAH